MLSLDKRIKYRSAAPVGGRFERGIKALHPSRRFFAVSNAAVLFIGTVLMVQGQARTPGGQLRTFAPELTAPCRFLALWKAVPQ